ncbi:hypothetical protein NKH77_45520 [Streptomyces sp. M19]
MTSPGQAGIWGVARVAALERPQQWGGVVDLPEVLDSRATRRLTSILTGSVRSASASESASESAEPGVSDEDQLAVRDGRCSADGSCTRRAAAPEARRGRCAGLY